MVSHDDEAVPMSEVIDEFRRPQTYKEKVDLNRIESSLKQAMHDIGFNLKHVRENPHATKMAQFQFNQLVKQLD